MIYYACYIKKNSLFLTLHGMDWVRSSNPFGYYYEIVEIFYVKSMYCYTFFSQKMFI